MALRHSEQCPLPSSEQQCASLGFLGVKSNITPSYTGAEWDKSANSRFQRAAKVSDRGKTLGTLGPTRCSATVQKQKCSA